MLLADRRHVATNEVYQLTLDLDGLLHLWVGLEHTLVLSAGAVGDLLQAATQMEDFGTFINTPAMRFCDTARLNRSRTNDSQEVSTQPSRKLLLESLGGQAARPYLILTIPLLFPCLLLFDRQNSGQGK